MYCKLEGKYRKVYKRDNGTYFCVVNGVRHSLRKSQVKPGQKPKNAALSHSHSKKSSLPQSLQNVNYKFSSNPNTRLKALRKHFKRSGFPLTVIALKSAVKKTPSAKGIVRADLSKLRQVLKKEKSVK
jgi:hypothetical protein